MADLKKHSRSNEQVLVQSTEFDINSESCSSSTQDPNFENLVWRDLTSDQVISLVPLTPHELEAKLAEICSCYNYKMCVKEGCILDYYVSAFWFSKQVNFTNQQISAFFSLVKILLENIRDHQMPLVKNMAQLKNCMKNIVYGKHKRQSSIVLFNIGQAKLIMDYVTESLFQHYKLYELLFCTDTSDMDDTINQKLFVNVPPKAEFPFPPPLDEGIPEHVYSEYVLVAVQPPQLHGDSKLETKDERTQMVETPDPIQDQILVSDNVNTSSKLNQLEPEEIKQVLRTVSHGILDEVKSGVQKKLKEREAIILSKLPKK